MLLERPDLSQVSPQIREYIEALEAEVARLEGSTPPELAALSPETAGFHEPPTPLNLVTLSKSGRIKRTPRHFYTRQRRGGMGVFDLDLPEEDPPAHILVADEGRQILILTDLGRGYWLPLSALPESEVRSRGQRVSDLLDLPASDRIVAAVPEQHEGTLALLSRKGFVRLLRHNFVNPSMQPGTPLLDTGRCGPLAAAAWMAADEEVFIATRAGLGIRFQGKQVHPSGSLGIRLEAGDAVVSVCGARDGGLVFMMAADGRGTIRQMEGFRANKSPGGGGKVAMKTDHLAGAIRVEGGDDLFVISRLSKIIRFQAAEIPFKAGVVQGVNCISLRADEAVAITASPAIPEA